MRADVARVGGAQREELALGIERELRLHRKVAGVVVAEEAFLPLGAPLYRAAEALRRPCHQGDLGTDVVAGAVASAYVARHEAHRAFRHPERGGRVGAKALHTAGRRVDGVAPVLVRRRYCAQFERHAGYAVDRGVEPHYMRGAFEGGIDGRGITDLGVDEDARLQRKHRVVDLHGIGPVLRRVRRLGDHHGHHFADEAHLVGGQHGIGRNAERRAVAVRELDLVGIDRDRLGRNRRQPIRGGVLAGQDGDDPGDLLPDGKYSCVRVRRAHHAGMHLPRQAPVVGVTAGAAQQAIVLLAGNRLADH